MLKRTAGIEMKELLMNALKEAGQIQKEWFGATHSIRQKESISSIVTEVDGLCEQAIIGRIQHDFPFHRILAEESGEAGEDQEYTWIIDPLDGTSNYAAGIPWFGVLIALFKQGEPWLAGSYLPVQDQLFFAEKGHGAQLNGTPVLASSLDLKNSLVAYSADFSDDPFLYQKGMDWYSYLLKNSRNIRSTNSLLDMMMVANGQLGGMVNLCCHIWDVAAPWLIIKESGGNMTDLDGKEIQWELGKNATSRNYSVLAGGPGFFRDLLSEKMI